MQSFICKHLPVSCKCNSDGKCKESVSHVAGILTPHKSLTHLIFSIWFLASSNPRKVKFYSLQNLTPGSHIMSPATLHFWKLSMLIEEMAFMQTSSFKDLEAGICSSLSLSDTFSPFFSPVTTSSSSQEQMM